MRALAASVGSVGGRAGMQIVHRSLAVIAVAATLTATACGDGATRQRARSTKRSTTTSSTTTSTSTTSTSVPATTTAATAVPPTAPPPGSTLAFGDSVMVDVRAQLEAHGIAVDASVNRQFFNAARDLTMLALAGRLPVVVVVGLGTNGPFNAEQFDAVMQSLAKARRVAFVNVCEPRWWQDPVNTAIAEGVQRWKSKAVLVDWHATSCGHPEWFAADRVHVNPAGAAVYADLVVRAISS